MEENPKVFMCKRATESPKFVKSRVIYVTFSQILTDLNKKKPAAAGG